MDGLFLQSGGLFGSLGGQGSGVASAISTFQTIIMWAIIGLVACTVIGIVAWKRYDNKKYNIKLQIIVPRSDGRVVNWYEGVGAFSKSRRVGGATSFLIKRKGFSRCEIPPPRSDFIIAPNNTLLLAQKGIDDYEPIMPRDLSKVRTKEGVFPILSLKAINQDATAWGFDIEETAKQRFTFSSLWEKYQMMITMMTFVFILFLVLYINWIGMKDVVAGLSEVARLLKSSVEPIITPGG